MLECWGKYLCSKKKKLSHTELLLAFKTEQQPKKTPACLYTHKKSMTDDHYRKLTEIEPIWPNK